MGFFTILSVLLAVCGFAGTACCFCITRSRKIPLGTKEAAYKMMLPLALIAVFFSLLAASKIVGS